MASSLSSSSSPSVEDSVQFRFLVKVVSNRLELQLEVLKKIAEKYNDNDDNDNTLPVAFISVVGQPKSRKTHLTNALKDFVAQSAGAGHFAPNFPSKSNGEQDRLNLDCENGILIWTRPLIIQRGDDNKNRMVVLFLDIWSEGTSQTVYTKLVNFCITVSSILVITNENCSPDKELLWDVTKSHLNEKGLLKQLQIHIEHSEKNAISFKLSVLGKNLDEGKQTLESLKLHGINDIANFLGDKCFHTSLNKYCTNFQQNQDQDSILISKEYFFSQEPLNPKDINPQTQVEFISQPADGIYDLLQQIPREKPYTLSSLKDSLEEVVNELDILTTSTDQIPYPEATTELNESKFPTISESQKSQNSSMERKDVKGTENVEAGSDTNSELSEETDEDIESQFQIIGQDERSQKNDQGTEIREDNPTVADNETDDHENSKKVVRMDIDEPTVELESKSGNTSSGSQYPPPTKTSEQKYPRTAAVYEYQKRQDNASKTQITTSSSIACTPYAQGVSWELKSLIETKRNDIITKLNKVLQEAPLNFQASFSNLNFSQFITQVERQNKLKLHETQWLRSQNTKFESDLHLLQRTLKEYVEQMKERWGKSICFQPLKVNGIHQECVTGIESLKAAKWNHDQLLQVAQDTVVLIRTCFVAYNSEVVKEEEKLVEEVLSLAEKTYKNFMQSKMDLAIHTNKQVKILHQIGLKSVQQAFFNPQDQINYSFVWSDCNQKIVDRLQPMQNYYLKMNLDKFHALETSKRLVTKCEKIYKETMYEQMEKSVHKVPPYKMADFHKKAKEEAFEFLNENKAQNLDLESALNEKLKKLRLEFDEENERKPIKEDYNVNVSCVQKIPSKQFFKEPVNISVSNTIVINSITKTCGIGMYFGPDNVQLRVHKTGGNHDIILNHYPEISFLEGSDPIFSEKSKGSDCFNIHKLLLPSTPNEQKTVSVFFERISLLPEEIVAIFLDKIKSEAEKEAKIEIKSCVVATSAFMDTVARRRLKSALLIAGFENSTLIQSTTALGLFYVVQNKLDMNQSIALIHHSTSTFDIALAEIKRNYVCIKRIAGVNDFKSSYFFKDPRIEIIDSTMQKFENDYSDIVAPVICVDGNSEMMSLIHERMKKSVTWYPRVTMHQNQDKTSLGAAFLHASQNSNSLLLYKEVFPHTLLLKVDGVVSATILHCNTPISSEHMKMAISLPEGIFSYKRKKITVEEKGASCLTSFEVERNLTVSEKYQVNLNLDFEGWIASVEVVSKNTFKPLRVQSVQEFMSRSEQNESMKKLELALLPSINVGAVAERQNQSCSSRATFNDDNVGTLIQSSNQAEKEEILKKLKDLIEKTKTRLDRTTKTSNSSANRCRDRIKTCEEAIRNPDVKAKALQMNYNQLEVCASNIIDE